MIKNFSLHKKTAILFFVAILAIIPAAVFVANKVLIINNTSAVTITHPIPYGYETITDPYFYDCVVENYISEFPNDTINSSGLSNWQLSQIEILDCDLDDERYNQITDVKGLEEMASLTKLRLDGRITDIDLSGNMNLEDLGLKNTQLTSIDLFRQESLVSLSILGDYDNGGSLTEIDLSRATDLEWLDLSHNQLTEIDLSSNTKLLYVYLDDNQLTGIDLSGNPELKELYIDYNKLIDLDIANNRWLKTISASNNLLTEFDASDPDNDDIIYLDLRYNSIFDFSGIRNLLESDPEEVDLTLDSQEKTVKTDSATYELPPLFAQVRMEENSFLFTDEPFELENATLSDDEKSITITDITIPATITIIGGGADDSVLTVEYNGEGPEIPDPETYTYVLSFNANGGIGAPIDLTYGPTEETSHTFTIPETTPTREDYVFLGWADSATAISPNANYAPGSTVTIHANKTLYAVWENPNTPDPETYTFVLSFNANGGTGAPTDLTYGPTEETSHTFTIPETTPTREDYVFLGWADKSDATDPDYDAEGEITLSADRIDVFVPGYEKGETTLEGEVYNKVLYAVWEKETKVPDTGFITGENGSTKITYILPMVSVITIIGYAIAKSIKKKKVSFSK